MVNFGVYWYLKAIIFVLQQQQQQQNFIDYKYN